jgi:hypothetical protein
LHADGTGLTLAVLIGTGIGKLVNLNGPVLIVLDGSLSTAGAILTCPLRPALEQGPHAGCGGRVDRERTPGALGMACGGAAFVFERCTSPRRGKTALTQLEQRVAAGETTLDPAAEVRATAKVHGLESQIRCCWLSGPDMPVLVITRSMP